MYRRETAGLGDSLSTGASRMAPMLLPSVTGWIALTKNGDTDTSLEKKRATFGGSV